MCVGGGGGLQNSRREVIPQHKWGRDGKCFSHAEGGGGGVVGGEKFNPVLRGGGGCKKMIPTIFPLCTPRPPFYVNNDWSLG